MSFIITSMTVVEARAYSLARGPTWKEAETGNFGPKISRRQRQQSLLVRGIHEAVDEADRQALDAAALEDFEFRARLGFIQLDQHRAAGQDALVDAAAQIASHQRPCRIAEGPMPARIGLVVHGPHAAARVQHVAVSLRGEEADLGQASGSEPH